MCFTNQQVTHNPCWLNDLLELFLSPLRLFHLARLDCTEVSFTYHLQFYSPIRGWFLPEDAWAWGRALGWRTGTGTLAMGLHNCSCCRSRVECVANRIGYNGGSICQDYCWEGWTLTQPREEQIQRGKKTAVTSGNDDKAGVCRAHVVHAPLTPSIFNCSAFRLFCKQYLCKSNVITEPSAGKMETTSCLTTAAREVIFSRRNGKCRNC